MKSAILIPNVSDQSLIDQCHQFCDNVILYSKEEILQPDFLPKNKIDFYLLLKENESIKYCDSLQGNNKVFLIDSSWMVLQKRIFSLNSLQKDDGLPIIIQSNEKLHGPFINHEILKSLYLQKKYDEFTLEAEKFLFDNYKLSYPMIRYYISMIYYFKLQNPSKAQVHISFILNEKRSMAEAWCLLGDILVSSKRYFEAIKAYENAIVYGKYRDIYDGDPVWLSRYDLHPREMLGKIQKLIDNTQIISINKI